MDSKKSREIPQETKASEEATSDKITKLLNKKARQLKSNQSFEKVKIDSSRDLGELQTIDIKKQSKQNLHAIRERLKKLTPEEKVLLENLMQQPLILHHTTRHQVIEEIKSTTGALRDPHELARYEQKTQEIHTPDFAGFSENVFFGLGTPLSEVPTFTRFNKDPVTEKPVDYCTVRIDLAKLRVKRPDVFENLWSSGHLFPFFSMVSASRYQQEDITIGETKITWKYEIQNAMSKEEERVKNINYTYANGETKSIKVTIKDEVAVGKDLIPFFALSFIERFRLLDEKTKQKVVKNPSELSKLMDVFFPVNEFEIHLPANMPLNDEYTSFVTPAVRKQITQTVESAAKKGDMAEIIKLYQDNYPIQGFMYEDPFRYDNDSTVDNPLIAALKAREYKAAEWFIEQGVYQDAFDYSSETNVAVSTNQLLTVEHIAKVLNAVAATRDINAVKALVEKYKLKINHFSSSKFSEFREEKLKTATILKAYLGFSSEEKGLYDYDQNSSDLIFTRMLQSGIPASHEIYQYLRDQLDYCKTEDFIIREMYDIAAYGTSEQMAYHQQSNPYYPKYKSELFKIAVKRPETQVAAFEMIKADKEAIKKEIKNLSARGLTERVFSREYAELLLSRTDFENDPFSFFKKLDDMWLHRYITSTRGYKIEKKEIVGRLQWLVERLHIAPDQPIVKPYYYEMKEYRENIITALCSHSCFAEAKAYIEQGFSAHDDKIEYNPIHYALMRGDLDFAHYLLNEKKVPVSFPADFISKNTFKPFTPETLALAFKLGAIPDYRSYYNLLRYRDFHLAEVFHQQGLVPWRENEVKNRIDQCNELLIMIIHPDPEKVPSVDAVEWLLKREIVSLDVIHALHNYCNETKLQDILTKDSRDQYAYGKQDAIVRINYKVLIQLLQLFVNHRKDAPIQPDLLVNLFIKNPNETLNFCNANKIPLNDMIKSMDDSQKANCLMQVCKNLLEKTASEVEVMLILKWLNESCSINVDKVLVENQDFLFHCLIKIVGQAQDFHHVLAKFLQHVDNLSLLENKHKIFLIRKSVNQLGSAMRFLLNSDGLVGNVKLLLQYGAFPFYREKYFEEIPELKACYHAFEPPKEVDELNPEFIEKLLREATDSLTLLQDKVAIAEKSVQTKGLFQSPNLLPYIQKLDKIVLLLNQDFTLYDFDASLKLTPADCKQIQEKTQAVVGSIKSYLKEKHRFFARFYRNNETDKNNTNENKK